MTIEQQLDQIAAADGLKKYEGTWCIPREEYDFEDDSKPPRRYGEPIELDLSWIACAWSRMAPEWKLTVGNNTKGGKWYCWGYVNREPYEEIKGDGPDELTARTACLHAVLVKKGVIKC